MAYSWQHSENVIHQGESGFPTGAFPGRSASLWLRAILSGSIAGRSDCATVIRCILKWMGTCRGHLGMCGGFLVPVAWGWREPLIRRDRSQGCQMSYHVQDHPAK